MWQDDEDGRIITGNFKCLVLLNFVVLGSESGGAAGLHTFSGRPGTRSVKDFEDRLLAAFAKARLQEKKLTRAEFLLQFPAYLEHKALHLWRKHRANIFTLPEDSKGKWDPIAEVIALFKKHLGLLALQR